KRGVYEVWTTTGVERLHDRRGRLVEVAASVTHLILDRPDLGEFPARAASTDEPDRMLESHTAVPSGGCFTAAERRTSGSADHVSGESLGSAPNPALALRS